MISPRSSLSRRDFLRLAGLGPLALALPPLARQSGLGGPSELRQNVLIVVLDAFSAHHLSLHGYARQTTPNLDRLAKKAIVYHRHYAAANFTTPGTASLLTGVYPWTHRAMPDLGRMIPRFNARNIFAVFDDYYRFAYTHNGWAYTILRPMAAQLSALIPIEQLCLESPPEFIADFLGKDQDAASIAWGRAVGRGAENAAYSLYLSHVVHGTQDRPSLGEVRRHFPRGVPGDGYLHSFVLETAVDWLASQALQLPQPFFGYIHVLPPHAPYRTREEYIDRFVGDGFVPVRKPASLFAAERRRDELTERRHYDEFILYVDAEFARLHERLERAGALQDTWLVLTSDHGELFERGLEAHGTDTLYEPEVRVPLMIFEPGRQQGVEVHTPTSAVDLLPTLAQVTGHPLPPWSEGAVLPPYDDGMPSSNRGIYSLAAEDNDPLRPIHNATGAIVKGDHKLQYYFGYGRLQGRELVQLFDIGEDPEELVDVSAARPEVTRDLLAELKLKISEADKPYRR